MNNPQELAQAYMRLRSREVRKNPSLLDEPDSKIDYKDITHRLIDGSAESKPLTIFIYKLSRIDKYGVEAGLESLVVNPKMHANTYQEVIENLSKIIVERFNEYSAMVGENNKRKNYPIMKHIEGYDLEVIKTMDNGEVERRNITLFDLATNKVPEFGGYYNFEKRFKYTPLGGGFVSYEEKCRNDFLKEIHWNAKVEEGSLLEEYIHAASFFEGSSKETTTFANLTLIADKFINEYDSEIPFKINLKQTIGYKIDALAQFAKNAANAHYVELGNVATIEYEPRGERYFLITGESTYSLDNNDIRDNGALERLEKDVALRKEYLDLAKNYSNGEIPPYGDIAKDILDKNDDVCSFRSEIANRFDEYNKEAICQDEAIRKPIKIVEAKPEIKAESLNL
jgi:hypothetical protein